MQTIIGTSGWMYSDWNGVFYPEGVKSKDKLPYFATQFSSVEINSTFYHVPLESSVQNWHDITPANFKFAIKLNRYLTHTKRLVVDDELDEQLHEFFRRISLLKEKLAAVLVQLPPSQRADTTRLEHLAQQVKLYEKEFSMRFRLAIEFRNASWFNEDTYAVMHRHNLANVINDSPNRWPASRAITADFSYIRLHGNRILYRSSYTDTELAQWAAFIKQAATQCDTVFAYFDNDNDAAAVGNARTLIDIINKPSTSLL
jgi:uncharacterized protein YecE (DUF72 family)